MSMNSDTVGKYFRDANGELWQMISYCEYPTATLEKVGEPDVRRGGAVGCMNLAEFEPVTETENSAIGQAVQQVRIAAAKKERPRKHRSQGPVTF